MNAHASGSDPVDRQDSQVFILLLEAIGMEAIGKAKQGGIRCDAGLVQDLYVHVSKDPSRTPSCRVRVVPDREVERSGGEVYQIAVLDCSAIRGRVSECAEHRAGRKRGRCSGRANGSVLAFFESAPARDAWVGRVCEWLVVPKHREQIVGDLLEQRHRDRKDGVPEWKINVATIFDELPVLTLRRFVSLRGVRWLAVFGGFGAVLAAFETLAALVQS